MKRLWRYITGKSQWAPEHVPTWVLPVFIGNETLEGPEINITVPGYGGDTFKWLGVNITVPGYAGDTLFMALRRLIKEGRE